MLKTKYFTRGKEKKNTILFHTSGIWRFLFEKLEGLCTKKIVFISFATANDELRLPFSSNNGHVPVGII